MACFSNKKYPVTIQTRTKQIVNTIFLMEKTRMNNFFKDYWCTKSITNQFCTRTHTDF